MLPRFAWPSRMKKAPKGLHRPNGRRRLFGVPNIKMERVKGIEPSYSAWKAAALPLSYTRPLTGDMPRQGRFGKAGGHRRPQGHAPWLRASFPARTLVIARRPAGPTRQSMPQLALPSHGSPRRFAPRDDEVYSPNRDGTEARPRAADFSAVPKQKTPQGRRGNPCLSLPCPHMDRHVASLLAMTSLFRWDRSL